MGAGGGRGLRSNRRLRVFYSPSSAMFFGSAVATAARRTGTLRPLSPVSPGHCDDGGHVPCVALVHHPRNDKAAGSRPDPTMDIDAGDAMAAAVLGAEGALATTETRTCYSSSPPPSFWKRSTKLFAGISARSTSVRPCGRASAASAVASRTPHSASCARSRASNTSFDSVVWRPSTSHGEGGGA